MVNITVIICTHNPQPDYLRRVLESLRQQTMPLADWELLFVDNASNEVLADKWDLSWHPGGHHIREDELGLTPARLRGIAESRGELLVFVDDDNVLETSYLANAHAIHLQFPQLGCFGAARILPEFETPPAQHVQPYVEMVGLKNHSEDHWSNAVDDPFEPIGAGICVVREVAEKYASEIRSDPFRKSLGRRGSSLLCHEDNDLLGVACRAGYGKGIFQNLGLTHLIPSTRLKLDYLLNLFEGNAFSTVLLEAIHQPEALARTRRSVPSKLVGWMRYLRATPLERRFLWARYRGRSKGRDFVRQHAPVEIKTLLESRKTDFIPVPPL